MKQLRKFSFSLGGLIIAAGALMLTAPRAAHAVAAALVQITNTAANPAITQGIGQQASHMVHLSCEAGDGVNFVSGHCYAFTPEGSRLDPAENYYAVPSNQTLVIAFGRFVRNCGQHRHLSYSKRAAFDYVLPRD